MPSDIALTGLARDLAARAKTGKSGMRGVLAVDAIINPPQLAILADGAATMMSLTLSVDHRVIGGALGAALFQSIRSHLESPIALLA